MKLKQYSTAMALLLASSTGWGYTLTQSPDCDVAASVFNPAYDACSGAYALGNGENDVTDGDADNIVNQLLNDDKVFGDDGWIFGAKFDGSYSGMSDLFTMTGLNSTSGVIDLNTDKLGASGEFDIVISLKAAKDFSLYAWMPLDEAANGEFGNIEWTTDGTSTNKKGVTRAVSHASVYYRKSTTTTTIAEPMTIGLFAFGLFGLAAFTRRK